MQDWWPGAQYVTWVGVDGYYYSPSRKLRDGLRPTIDQVRTFTKKPVLLSETAVGPAADPFAEDPGPVPRGWLTDKTLGLVWFDRRRTAELYHQDWRIEDNGLRQGVVPARRPRGTDMRARSSLRDGD